MAWRFSNTFFNDSKSSSLASSCWEVEQLFRSCTEQPSNKRTSIDVIIWVQMVGTPAKAVPERAVEAILKMALTLERMMLLLGTIMLGVLGPDSGFLLLSHEGDLIFGHLIDMKYRQWSWSVGGSELVGDVNLEESGIGRETARCKRRGFNVLYSNCGIRDLLQESVPRVPSNEC